MLPSSSLSRYERSRLRLISISLFRVLDLARTRALHRLRSVEGYLVVHWRVDDFRGKDLGGLRENPQHDTCTSRHGGEETEE